MSELSFFDVQPEAEPDAVDADLPDADLPDADLPSGAESDPETSDSDQLGLFGASPAAPSPAAPAPAARPAEFGPSDALAGIVGQPQAVDVLREALSNPLPGYLFVGPSAAGLRDAACRFAGELLALSSDRPDAERHLAVSGGHPDVLVFDRIGPALTADQARDAVRLAQLSPSAGKHKVLVICDAHLAVATAPILLKAVEEPTVTTTFVITAESVTPALVTLASRCVQVQFAPLDEATIAGALATDGYDEATIHLSAAAANGSLERARLLAADEAAAQRIELWSDALGTLNGTGANALSLVDELLEAIGAAADPLRQRQTAELAADAEAVEALGINRRKNAEMDARHARELRRHQADELAMGLTILAHEVRRCAPERGVAWAHQSTEAIAAMREAIAHNANARAALACLFLRIGG